VIAFTLDFSVQKYSIAFTLDFLCTKILGFLYATPNQNKRSREKELPKNDEVVLKTQFSKPSSQNPVSRQDASRGYATC
jgi:uncharacterized protein (DUF362 family)